MENRIKICGLKRVEDAELAAGLGAWALGVIFAPESPRRVTLEAAAELFQAAGEELERVGVFVNAPEEEIAAAAAACGLTAVQLHGEESPEVCRRVAEQTGCRVIKAVRVSDEESLAGVVRFDTKYILLDTYHPERRGGTGETFDWEIAARLPADELGSRIILSGGLNPENVRQAVAAVKPFAVDVSSGVEVSPGVKDPRRLEELFEAIGD